MYNLAVYYLDGRGGVERDVDMAMILLEKAAAEGLSQAQTDLGVLVSEERGDWHQAAHLFSSAAQQNVRHPFISFDLDCAVTQIFW